MTALLGLPTWLMGSLIIGLSGLFSLGATLAFRQVTKGRRREGHNEVLGFLFSAAAVLYAVIVAFVVFAVWERFTAAEETTSQEAATLVSLYFDTETFPTAIRSEAQRSIRDYTMSTIEDEWPMMARGEQSPDTRVALDHLYVVYASLQPASGWTTQLDSGSFDRLNQVALLRSERLQSSKKTLPDVFWVVLIAGGILTLVLPAPLFMEHGHYHLASSLLLGFTVGAVLFLILALDHPFTGSVGIQPDDFRENLQIYTLISIGA